MALLIAALLLLASSASAADMSSSAAPPPAPIKTLGRNSDARVRAQSAGGAQDQEGQQLARDNEQLSRESSSGNTAKASSSATTTTTTTTTKATRSPISSSPSMNSNTFANDYSAVGKLFIQGDTGNVGIGSSDTFNSRQPPERKLEVDGDVFIGGALYLDADGGVRKAEVDAMSDTVRGQRHFGKHNGIHLVSRNSGATIHARGVDLDGCPHAAGDACESARLAGSDVVVEAAQNWSLSSTRYGGMVAFSGDGGGSTDNENAEGDTLTVRSTRGPKSAVDVVGGGYVRIAAGGSVSINAGESKGASQLAHEGAEMHAQRTQGSRLSLDADGSASFLLGKGGVFSVGEARTSLGREHDSDDVSGDISSTRISLLDGHYHMMRRAATFGADSRGERIFIDVRDGAAMHCDVFISSRAGKFASMYRVESFISLADGDLFHAPISEVAESSGDGMAFEHDVNYYRTSGTASAAATFRIVLNAKIAPAQALRASIVASCRGDGIEALL